MPAYMYLKNSVQCLHTAHCSHCLSTWAGLTVTTPQTKVKEWRMEPDVQLTEFSSRTSETETESDIETDREDHVHDEHVSNGSVSFTASICSCLVRSSSTVPKDHYLLVYIAMILVGMGVLFPWNSFVSALDYFIYLYGPYYPEVAIPFTNLLVTLGSMGFTIATVNFLPLHCRISFGYVMFIIVLVFLPLFDLVIHNCLVSPLAGFLVTLCSVVLMGLGSGGELRGF